MNKIISVAIAFLLFTTIACENENKNEKDISLRDKVMVVHDKVMPKMKDITFLKDSISQVIDKQGLSDEDSIRGVQIQKDLKSADKQMMNWMYNWEEREDSTYLKKELKKIRNVRDSMLNSIKKARKYLETYEK